MSGTVHIIGAGLAGLSAALQLAGARRDGRRARGDGLRRRPLPLLSRRRARHDDRQRQSPVAVGQSRRARLSARASAPRDRLIGPPTARISVRRSGERRALDAALQRRPPAVVDFRSRRGACPARARSIICRWRGCCGRRRGKTVGEVIACEGPLYERLVEPLLLAALNIDAAAGLGAACRRGDPRDARRRRARLPAADRARRLGRDADRAGARRCCSSAARRCAWSISCARSRFGAERVEALDFGGETIALGADDAVILAVPPYAAASLVPRPRRADRVPRHRQRAFPHRAAGRTAADPRRAQRHGANGCLPFPAGCRSPSAPAIG